jgi:hypothetical protein
MPTLLDKPARWLADIPWEDVVAANAALCATKGALHKVASGGAKVAAAWQDAAEKEMTFHELAGFLLRCHRTAPFCFFNNGNTFSAIARDLLADVPMPVEQAVRVRSAAGHAIAGVMSMQELREVLAAVELPALWEW